MQISISGKSIDVGQALKDHVSDELDRIVGKYFDKAIRADVVFDKQRHLFCTDVIVNEGTGSDVIIKSQGEAGDAHASFADAAEKIEKQLRRYKRKLKNHHKIPQEEALQTLGRDVKKFVLSSSEEEVDETKDTPLIVAEKTTKIDRLTVSEAVMRMDMLDINGLMFVNRLTDTLCTIYRRRDGHISWIDSEIKHTA